MTEKEIPRGPDRGVAETGDFPVPGDRRRARDPEIVHLEKLVKRAAAVVAAILILGKALDFTGGIYQGAGTRIDQTNRRLDTLTALIGRADSLARAARKQEATERKQIRYELCLLSAVGRTPNGATECARIFLRDPPS